MAFSSNNKGKLFTEINITPLTDIFLVLLIIMMVVAPTFQSMDNAITIPEINSGVAIEQKNATIAITRDGQMYLNGTPITEDQLTSELAALKETIEKPEVVVKADENVKSAEIMKVMNAAQDAEYKKLIVAGEPLSKKEQKDLKKENLRDNMTNVELVLNMLAEVSTTEFSKERNPETFEESKVIARKGGEVAKSARQNIEKQLGHKVVTSKNAKNIKEIENQK